MSFDRNEIQTSHTKTHNEKLSLLFPSITTSYSWSTNLLVLSKLLGRNVFS